MRTFKETSKIVEEVANIALQAAEEKRADFPRSSLPSGNDRRKNKKGD